MFDIWRESTFSLEDLRWFDSTTRNCLILILSVFIVIYFKQRHGSKLPPYHGGWVPWLGCAADFGKQPLEFIRLKSKQFGSIFTLYVAGETLTFLTDTEDFHYFFDNADLDFQHAVQAPVQKLASINCKQFFKYHTRLHDMMKGRLAPTRIGQFIGTLSRQVDKQLDRHVEISGQEDLMVITRKCMYASILNTLFGEGNPLVHNEADYEEFLKQFKVFDDSFELGLKLPSIFMPKWAAAKKYFLQRMELTLKQMRGQTSHLAKQNLIDALWERLEGDSVTHKYGMLVMFSSIANSVPAAYWAVMFILTNDRVKEKVLQELKEVFGENQEGFHGEIQEEDLKKLTYLRQCVYETIRLRGEGIIGRKVVKDTKIKGYDIKAGTMVLISPYWSHRDERNFPEPETFQPERWENSSIDKHGFVAFGGGRYQCPGRWFGMMSIQTFAAIFLLKYKCSVHSNAPTPSLKHLVGVLHPESEFLISCDRKETV